MSDKAVKITRQIGWLMFIVGLLAIAGIAVFGFLFDGGIPIWMKLIIIAVYGGLAFLLFSVLRQRLIERKTDKYKDVEI
jgi:4-hydroxybenzoate polyprenyltransferase